MFASGEVTVVGGLAGKLCITSQFMYKIAWLKAVQTIRQASRLLKML